MSKLTEALGDVGTPWLIHKDHRERAAKAVAKAHEFLAGAPNLEKKSGEEEVETDAFFFFGGGDEDSDYYYDEGSTRVIKIEGVMIADESLPNWICSIFGLTKSNTIRRIVEDSARDSRIERIVLSIDSPGGQVEGVDALAYAVEKTEKPVEAHVWGMCCSAAYWTAAASDKIHTVPSGMVGSVGAVVTLRNPGNSEDYVEFVSSATPKKRMNPFDSDDAKRAEARAEFQNLADSLGDVFVKYVKDRRGDHNGKLDGSLFVGQIAVDNGYADSVSFLSDVLASQKRRKGPMSKKVEKNTAEETPKEVAPVAVVPEVKETPVVPVAEAAGDDRIKEINALPGSAELKLKAIVEGLTPLQAATLMLSAKQEATPTGNTAADAHLKAQTAHETGTEFPATHAKGGESQTDEAKIAAECLALWDKHGQHVPTQAKA